jgi:hypothetical protein
MFCDVLNVTMSCTVKCEFVCVHANKAYGGSSGINPLILNCGGRCCEWSFLSLIRKSIGDTFLHLGHDIDFNFVF